MSGSQPRVHATQSSTRQQQDKEVNKPGQQQTLQDLIHKPVFNINPIIQDWQPASSRKTKRKDKEKQVEQKQQKKQPRLSFRQHKSTEKTTDDMDISQDTFASSSESGGAAKSNTDNQVTPENLDAPIDGEKNDEMIVDNGKIDNQTDDQSFNKDNQKNGDTNDIISDNHSEIFNKAKPILVKIKKDSIPGNNIIQKKFNLRKQLAGINVTLAGGVILNKKEPEFIILPIMKNDYDKIINLEIDIIDDEQSHENGEDAESSTNSKVKEIIKFTPYQKTKKVFTEEEIKDRNCRTIKVINIPIEIPNYQIRAVFNKYGEIEENGFYTRIRNLYIQAFITYKKEESLQKFYKGIWSEWIGKHQVLIVPKILSEDEIEKRSMYTVKLTGLPWNSTAYDIHEALEVNNPKYIFIPRNPNNNKPLNYAIVYYENDEDIGIAAERNIIFCNRTLHWGTPGEKSCHRCGSFNHLISKCDIEPSAKPRVMNRKQKLKEFRQENNKKFKKGSYANVTKQISFEKRQQSNNSNNYSKYNNGNINRYWNKNISPNDFKKIQQENYRIKSEFYKYKENKSTTSSGKNIKVNQDRSTIALQNENNKRSRVDNEQLEASGSSDIENSLNKQNNEINRFGDALSTMSKNISKIMEYFTSDNNNDVNNFQGDKIIDNNESHED
ncbi:hypothetical protein GLOIN_2v1493636 [Rhizophagus irregularis DAOM 181602=DAOM 197198]|nr:hypothetical protein GLOIN_2v1493636 [Rhizophagus irregularis DAOM 181602=DAOM 197198]